MLYCSGKEYKIIQINSKTNYIFKIVLSGSQIYLLNEVKN